MKSVLIAALALLSSVATAKPISAEEKAFNARREVVGRHQIRNFRGAQVLTERQNAVIDQAQAQLLDLVKAEGGHECNVGFFDHVVTAGFVGDLKQCVRDLETAQPGFITPACAGLYTDYTDGIDATELKEQTVKRARQLAFYDKNLAVLKQPLKYLVYTSATCESKRDDQKTGERFGRHGLVAVDVRGVAHILPENALLSEGIGD